MDIIQESINYYKDNRQDFILKYHGQHLVIKGAAIMGVYNTKTEALEMATKDHPVGTFIIERPFDLTKKQDSVLRKK